MLTPVERVLILKGVDLLKDVGPRHLIGLANVARELPIFHGDTIYLESDAADALYIVVEGRVRLSADGRTMSEVGVGEAFGTWSLVDDSARGHRAECVDDGLTLALHREEFYDVAAADQTILKELVRVLAKRLRELAAAAPPEEARVEGEGIGKPEAMVEAESRETAAPSTTGSAVAAAAAGRPTPSAETAEPLEREPTTREAGSGPEPVVAPEPIASPEPPAGPAASPPARPPASPPSKKLDR